MRQLLRHWRNCGKRLGSANRLRNPACMGLTTASDRAFLCGAHERQSTAVGRSICLAASLDAAAALDLGPHLAGCCHTQSTTLRRYHLAYSHSVGCTPMSGDALP